MGPPAFDLIAFDGDDTLWHNERSYQQARRRFRRILAAAGVVLSDDQIDACVNQTEQRNLAFYGYGVSSFVLSLIETAIELTDGGIPGRRVQELVVLARQMITEDVELFPGVESTLSTLAARYPLMLITKGDLLHQRSKLERSGLQPHFRFVEVVSHKTADVYATILGRYDIDPSRFLMVGNSLRSDVLPVVEIGGHAVYVPAALSWSHEHVHPTNEARQGFVELASLDGLAALVQELARS